MRFLQVIRVTLRLCEHAVGLLISHALLFDAVPHELAAEHVGEIAEVAEGGRAVAYLDVHGGSIRDGDLDIYITNIFSEALSQHNVLLRNESTAEKVLFRDVAEFRKVDNGYFGWGTTFADFDNDGDLDIAATNGWRSTDSRRYPPDPSRLFLNPGTRGLPFADVSAATGFDDVEYGSSLVAFDMERDGDMDLLQVVVDGALRLLENQSARNPVSGNNGLTIQPRMSGGNRFAIGAVVYVHVGGTQMMRMISAGTSYMGQEPAEAHFGLGTATTADTVTVEFPGGHRVELTDVTANQVLVVRPKVTSPLFIRGDTNGDGSIDLSDSVRIFQFLFLGASQPTCLDASDTNDDGTVELTDGVSLLERLFRTRFDPDGVLTRQCLTDETPDELSCSSFKSCRY